MMKLFYFTDTHGPFLLQSIADPNVLIKIIDNSVALGLLVLIGLFIFKDYQKRLTSSDERLKDQEKQHREAMAAKDAQHQEIMSKKDERTLELMLTTQNAVQGLTLLMEQQNRDNSRRDENILAILNGINATMEKQKTLFETFLQFNRRQGQ